ncbi:MAG: ANTAR domain-containing protein [Bacteroidales bacterium]|nr:ANTAR domain-containing protein [Bacteroidales bacterium]MCM1415990.1 ANTAR domain-containing protein [bacterium]MCM1422818.1 ANTAR domain-containing protein [bacterium]
MAGIIVVLPKPEDAKSIRNLLMKNGFQVSGVCTTGSQALSKLDDLSAGLVICSYRMSDMIYSELHACLPKDFEMLLLASRDILQECEGSGIVSLAMPFKVFDLINTVDMMCRSMERRRRKARQKPRERSGEEEALIAEAKAVLMNRNHMSEEEAHRYLQKCSMESGTNLVETAQMVLAMMRT